MLPGMKAIMPAVTALLLSGCFARAPMVYRTSIDYEAREVTLCGNRFAGKADLDAKAEPYCTDGANAVRCGTYSRVTGASAVYGTSSVQLDRTYGMCCLYRCGSRQASQRPAPSAQPAAG